MASSIVNDRSDAPAVFESDHRGDSTLTHHQHMTPYATIVLSGGYVEVNNAVPELCRVGDVVLHEPGEEHADRFRAETRCLNVELPEDWFHSSPSARNGKALPCIAAHRVTQAYRSTSSQLSDALRELYASLRLQQNVSGTEVPDWLERVIDGFPWTEGVPLREAAELVGLHETHFSRAFHRHMGMTAGEYRARARVRYASQLLLRTTDSISRVAAATGLSDQSHLTRLFSERLGVSPAVYRQAFAR
jgi:AraC family transcriptional regulator